MYLLRRNLCLRNCTIRGFSYTDIFKGERKEDKGTKGIKPKQKDGERHYLNVTFSRVQSETASILSVRKNFLRLGTQSPERVVGT
jgi:hypothetical protein